MFGNQSLGSKGATVFNATSHVTGSFIAIQGLVPDNLASGSAGLVTKTDTDGDTELLNVLGEVTWGDNRQTHEGVNSVGVKTYSFESSSIQQHIGIQSGDIIYGPIYKFRVIQGSVLAYHSK